MKQTKQSKKTVKINFTNAAAAEHFLSWLCESGEQDYFQWMEVREQEDEGNITAVSFDYNFEELYADTKCGRLDKEE